jgi:hypothetical protein
MLELFFPIDPGQHEVILQGGQRSRSTSFTVLERNTKTVTLSLLSGPEPRVHEVGSTTPTGNDSGSQARASSVRPWAWASLSVGTAGLAAGAISAVVLARSRRELAEDCVDRACPPQHADEVDRYNTLRYVTTTSLCVGVVGLTTGLVLLWTDPSGKVENSATVEPWLGLASAGVSGRF